MTSSPPRAILALCLGNICRSPIAEGVLRAHLERAGLNIRVDSAGTSAFHQGEAPDPRSIEVMRHHQLDISAQRSRPLTALDFERFELILAMDQSNLRNARSLAPTREAKERVQLLLDKGQEVPDPYYGGPDGFEQVLANQVGRAVLIDFSAAWCKRCQEAAAEVEAVHLGRPNVVVWTVLFDNVEGDDPTPDDLVEWSDSLGLTHTVLGDVGRATFDAWGGGHQPILFLVDADGFVRWNDEASDQREIEAAIDAL